jgi:membrane-associated phospholipid phosphatase
VLAFRHWLSDVIASAIIGLLAASLVTAAVLRAATAKVAGDSMRR